MTRQTDARQGFSLVEVIVALVILSVGILGMGASTGHVMNQIRVSELRSERMTGGPDIRAADPASVAFRAVRTVSFICDISRSEKWIVTASEGEPIARGDSMLIFVDGDSLRWQDDAWAPSVAADVAATSSAACATRFPGMAVQTVKLPVAQDLSGVRLYSPVRTFDWVTYTLQQDARPLAGSPVRRTWRDGKTAFLLGGLAAPARVGLPAQSLTTNLYLRNN